MRKVIFSLLLVTGFHAMAADLSPTGNQKSEMLPSVNISISPLEMVFGYAGVTAEFGVAKNITVGPYLSYWGVYGNIGQSSTSYQTFTGGAVSTISLGHPRFTNGWFVQPFIQYSLKTTTQSDAGIFGIGGNFGYGWFFDNGLNLEVGLGAKYGRIESSLFGFKSSGALFLPSALFQLGYSF